MKKKIIILCLLLALIIIGIVFFNKEKSNLKIYQGNDITLSIKENTLTNTSATIIITDNSNKKHTYGNEFLIERKIKNTWYKLAAQETWWEPIGYEVDENNKLELPQNWESIYGKLKKGTYRLLKKVGSTNEYIYVEFEIK